VRGVLGVGWGLFVFEGTYTRINKIGTDIYSYINIPPHY
jgi:hypothetical protein